jgi:prepilin-type N-terminal cleavage/methylation domain-containing protein
MHRRYFVSGRGFTLIEVLVAITILGLGIVTLLQIFSLGLRLGARSAARTAASADAAAVMDELLAQKKLSDGTNGGARANGVRWKSQVQTLRDSPSTLGLANAWELREIAVEVLPTEGGRDRPTELKTFRLGRKANP